MGTSDLATLEGDIADLVARVEALVADLPDGSALRADLECVLVDRLRPALAEVRRMAAWDR